MREAAARAASFPNPPRPVSLRTSRGHGLPIHRQMIAAMLLLRHQRDLLFQITAMDCGAVAIQADRCARTLPGDGNAQLIHVICAAKCSGLDTSLKWLCPKRKTSPAEAGLVGQLVGALGAASVASVQRKSQSLFWFTSYARPRQATATSGDLQGDASAQTPSRSPAFTVLLRYRTKRSRVSSIARAARQ